MATEEEVLNAASIRQTLDRLNRDGPLAIKKVLEARMLTADSVVHLKEYTKALEEMHGWKAYANYAIDITPGIDPNTKYMQIMVRYAGTQQANLVVVPKSPFAPR